LTGRCRRGIGPVFSGRKPIASRVKRGGVGDLALLFRQLQPRVDQKANNAPNRGIRSGFATSVSNFRGYPLSGQRRPGLLARRVDCLRQRVADLAGASSPTFLDNDRDDVPWLQVDGW
jgi:hypothetical protein